MIVAGWLRGDAEGIIFIVKLIVRYSLTRKAPHECAARDHSTPRPALCKSPAQRRHRLSIRLDLEVEFENRNYAPI